MNDKRKRVGVGVSVEIECGGMGSARILCMRIKIEITHIRRVNVWPQAFGLDYPRHRT